jgi:hypothetical protein
MQPDPDTIRKLVAHETEMVNHRMSWFLVLQGFMLAGLAFGWEKSSALCTIFSSVGILSSLSVGILLRYGILAAKRLEESNPDGESPVVGRGYKETPRIIHFLLPWHFLPIVFMVAWVALMVIRYLDGS